MTGKITNDQEMLRFKLKAYLRKEETKKAIAERELKHFEEEAAKLYAHISELFSNEPGLEVVTGFESSQDADSNVGWLEIDIVGNKVKISPASKEGKRVLDVSGLEKGFYFELDHIQWRVTSKEGYGWNALDDSFWFTKLAVLVPN